MYLYNNSLVVDKVVDIEVQRVDAVEVVKSDEDEEAKVVDS